MAENTNTNTPIDEGLSLSSPVSYSSKEHNDIIDSLREATVSYDLDSKIDMDSIKFMDNQAAAINKNSSLYPTRFNSPYPGNVSNNRNPFANQTGQFDLTTAQGRRDYIGGIGQRIANKQSDVPHGGLWKNPIIFGKKQMNADRYMNHPRFNELGFHPFVDNETYYNQNSTAWDDLSRTSTAFVSMFKPAFTSGWRTLSNTLSGDPFKMDYEGAEAMQDAMRIASSTRGGVTGFANDLYLNSSYTFGIVGSMFVEEAALAFMGGYILPGIAATKAAGRFKQIFNAADGLRTGVKTVGNYSADLMRSVGATDKAKDFYNYAKGTWGGQSANWMVRQFMPETTRAMQTINSTKNTAKNLSNLAKVNKTFGGFYRDIRMFNVAWAESRLEGGLREIESLEQDYMRAVKANNGRDLTEEQWAVLKNASKSAGLKTALMNFPIIYLSNKFVLDTALRGFKPLGRLLQESQAGLGRRIMRTGKAGVIKADQKAFQELGTGVKRGYKEILKGGLLGAGAFGVKYLQANFAEGFQELAQEAVSAGVGEYYTTLLDEVLADSMNMNSAELEGRIKNADASWIKSMRAGMQSEAVSFETFMSGFLMGGIVQPFQTIMFEKMPNLYKRYSDPEAFDAYDKAKKKYVTDTVNNLNDMWNDPLNFFNILKLNALSQRQFNNDTLVSSYDHNVMGFKDAKDQAIFSQIYTMLQNNKAGDFKAHIEAFQNMSDTDLVNAFENSDATAKEIRKRFNGILEKIDQIQDNYNNFNDKYVNPFNPSSYEVGTRIHAQEAIRYKAFEHAKMMFLFTKHTYERGVERMNSIVNNLKSDPVIDSIAANDIAALVDVRTEIGAKGSLFGLDLELETLQNETKVAPAKNASRELKEIYKNKIEKIKILEEYRKEILDNTNYVSSGTEMVDEKQEDGSTKKVQKRKVANNAKMKKSGKAKVKKVFIKYLNHIAKTTGGRIKDSDGIDKAFEMILDYKALNGRTRDYYKAQQVLDNPNHLNEVADRISVAMNKIWKHYKKKNVQRQKLTKFMDQQERGKIISDLARKGIYTNVDDAEIFIKTGVIPEDGLEWYTDEDRLTNISMIENPTAYAMVSRVFRNYHKQKEVEDEAKTVGEDVEVEDEDIEQGDLDAADTVSEEEDSVSTDQEDEAPEEDVGGIGPYKPRRVKMAAYIMFANRDPGTGKIINDRWEEYQWGINRLGKTPIKDKDGDITTSEDAKSRWIKSNKGGAYILKARYKLHEGYYKNKNQGYKDKTTFDQFLSANQTAPWMIGTVKKKGVIGEYPGLKVSDILVETGVNKNRKAEEGLDPTKDELVDTGDDYHNTGIKIVKRKKYDKDANDGAGGYRFHYLVLTMDNDNTADHYGGLPRAESKLKVKYNTDTEAKAAARWLKYNIPKRKTFWFTTTGDTKEEFTTGEIVVDKDGDRYTVESDGENVDSHGNLWIKNLKTKKSEYIPKGRFIEDKWKRSSEEDIVVGKSERITRIPMNEPLQIYPYDHKSVLEKEGKIKKRSALDKNVDRKHLRDLATITFQKLTPEEKDELEIRIEKNKDHETTMSMGPMEKTQFPRLSTYPINERLKIGAAKYNVVIYKGDKPLFVVQSPHDVVLYDKIGKDAMPIDPLLITQQQANRLFVGAELKTDSYKDIRRNYATSFVMEDVFKKVLENSNTDIANISLKQLRNDHKIHLQITNGKIAYDTMVEVTDETGALKFKKDGVTPREKAVSADSKIKEIFDNGNGFSLGEGFSGKNRDGDDEPYYYIIDQRNILNKEEVAEPDTIISNVPRRNSKEDRAFEILQDNIKLSLSRQGYDVRRSGRYVYFVISPGLGENGEYTAIQLKPHKKSAEEVINIFSKLRERGKTTKEENIKPGTDVLIDKKYQEKLGENKKLMDSLFISGEPGQHIWLEINDYGKLVVSYSNTLLDFRITKKYDYKYYSQILEGDNGTNTLIKEINKDINKLIKEDKTIIAKKIGDKKYTGKLNLQMSGPNASFRNSLPKEITGNENSFEWINENTDAVIDTNIRDNVRGRLVSTDTTAIDIKLNSVKDTAYEKSKDNIEAKANIKDEVSKESLEDDKYWTSLFENDDLETIDKSILYDIATELVENEEIKGEDKVAERKRILLEHEQLSSEIEEMRQEIIKDQTTPEATKKIDPSDQQEELEEIDKLNIELDTLKQKKFEKIWKRRSQKTLKNGKDNPAYILDENKRRGATLRETKLDPEVKALQDKVNNLDQAFKIVDKDFDGRDIEDINVFTDWLKKNLPDFIVIKDINDFKVRLKNKGITVGAFLTQLKIVAGKKKFAGQIYTNASNPFKYHEAFHSVFRLLLTEEEIVKYLKIAKKGFKAEGKNLKDELANLRLMSPTYAEMGEKELEDTLYEEWLADKFEDFKMNPKETKVDSEVKSWFKKLTDWIMSIFEKMSVADAEIEMSELDPDLHRLFENIDSGKYVSANVQNNRFTNAVAESSGGVSNPAFAIIQDIKNVPYQIESEIPGEFVTRYRRIAIPFPARDVDILMKQTAALYQDLKQKEIDNKNLPINKAKLIRKAVTMMTEMHNPDGSQYSRFNLKPDDSDKINTDKFKALDAIDKKHNALVKNKKEFIKGVNIFLDIVERVENILDTDDYIIEQENSESPYDINEKRNQEGHIKNVNEMIKMLILTTVTEVEDQYGNTVVNPQAPESEQISLKQSVDYIKVFNGLLKGLSGEKDPGKAIAKLWRFAQHNKQTEAFARKLFDKFFGSGGYNLVGEYATNENVPMPSVLEGQEILFQQVVKAFYMFETPFTQALRDVKTFKVSLISPDKQSDEQWQMTVWANEHDKQRTLITNDVNKGSGREVNGKIVDKSIILNTLDRLASNIDAQEISDKDLTDRAIEYSNFFKSKLGINLSPGFIEYSIALGKTNKTPNQIQLVRQYPGVRGILLKDESGWSDIVYLKEALENGENIFWEGDNEDHANSSDVQKATNAAAQEDATIKGVYARLQKWAVSNAKFDETVGATVLYDAEGNYIYKFQVPTLHLEISEDMNSKEGIKKLIKEKSKKIGYEGLKNNRLIAEDTDERRKMEAIADNNDARAIRLLGLKDTTFTKTKDGKEIENKSLDINTLPGRSFGNLTFNEFIGMAINMYGLNFNGITGKVKTAQYYNEELGQMMPFTYSPALIRVLSESNISDFKNLPIIEAIQTDLDENGNHKFTDEYRNGWLKRISERFYQIQENHKALLDGTREDGNLHDDHNTIIDNRQYITDRHGIERINENYGFDMLTLEKLEETDSDPTVGRAYKFNFDVDGLLSIQKVIGKIIELSEEDVTTKTGHLTKQEITYLKEGKQSVFIKNNIIGKLSNLNKNGIVEIEGKQYAVRYEGGVTSSNQNLDFAKLKKGLGEQIYTSKEEKLGYIHSFDLNGVPHWAKVKEIANWFKNKNLSKHKFTIIPLEQAKREDTSQQEDALFDNKLKLHLEKEARDGKTFEEAMDSYTEEDGGRTANEFIDDALNSQYARFDEMMRSTGAIKQVDTKLKDGFSASMFGSTEKVMAEAQKSRNKMNLTTDEDHNMRQIFFSNWLNTADMNDIIGGNHSMSLKDAVDAGKRAKDRNAGGKNAASIIGYKKLNIKATQKFGAIGFSDRIAIQKFNTEGITRLGDRTDGQVYMTINAFKHFWFGLGDLTPAQEQLIKKVEAGEAITHEEFFGSVEKGTEGFKQNKAYINSKKFVYADGQVYLKMSAIILRKSLDTNADGSIYKPNKELYHLRKTLERHEEETGIPMIAVPRSASKMRRTNFLDPDMTDKLFNGELIIGETIEGEETKNGGIALKAVQELDANMLRLQQVTPSNKIEIIEPIQIKNIITSEQDDTEIVILNGEEISIGQIRDMYRYSINRKLELNYYSRSSLIFDLPQAFDAIDKAMEAGKLTPDLEAFMDYAIAALESSQASTQNLEFFSKLKDGTSEYELNNPITIQKLTELMMSFFQKGVIGQRQPGKVLTLASDFGFRVVKQVEAIDENGTPIAWSVIQREDWRNRSSLDRRKANNGRGLIELEDNEEGIITGLEVGDIYSDRLRHDVIDWKRDDKGKLILKNGKPIDDGSVHTEFVTAAHFAEEMQLDPTKPIPDVIAKQFAVRIPSQDKHSAVNLKLVDHLPVDMGSTGIFAYEILEISGADYDIDKVYVQHKEFYKNKKGELVEYGKSKNLDIQFEEYLMNSEKEMDIRGTNLFYAKNIWLKRRRKTDALIEKSVKDIEEEFAQWVIANRENFFTQDERIMKQKFIEEKNEDIEDEKKQYKYDIKANEFDPIYKELDSRQIVVGALNILHLPVTKKDYKEFKEENKKVYNKGKENEITLYKEPYSAAHSNNILNFKIALLTNDSMARPKGGRRHAIKNEPASDKIFSDIWKSWETKNPNVYEKNRVDLGYDPNNLLGQYKLYRDSKEGSRNISAVVPINTVISWHREQKTNLRTLTSEGVSISLPKFNGWTYDTYDINYFVDPEASKKAGKTIQRKGKDAIRLYDAGSQLTSIMVDNQKNPYSAKLGLNKHAASIMANGMGLGIDPETLLLVINHPTIVSAYHKGLNKTNPRDPGPMKILRNIYNSYRNSKDKHVQDIWEDSLKIEVDDEMLINHSSNLEELEQEVLDPNHKRTALPETYLKEKLAVIREMLNLDNMKNHNNDLIGVSQIEKGNLRDIDAINSIEKSIDNLKIFESEEKYNESEIPFEYEFIKKIKNPDSIVGSNIKIFKHLSEKALPHLIVTTSKPFNKLFNLMRGGMGYLSIQQRQVAESKLRRDILSYLTIKAYMHNLSRLRDPLKAASGSLDNALIYDQIGITRYNARGEAIPPVRINEVVADAKKWLKDKGKENYFLEKFIKNQKDTAQQNKKKVNSLETKNFQRLSKGELQTLQASFLELQLNKKTRLAAQHIIHYLMVTHGLQNRFGSFIQVITPVLLHQYLESATGVKELFGRVSENQTKEEQDAEFKSIFGMTFSEIAKDLTKWFESSADTHYISKINQKGASVLNAPDIEHEIETISLDWDYIKVKSRTPLKNPKTLYIISDTIAQDGYGSELEGLRVNENVISIPVKKQDSGGFYTDDDYNEAIIEIDKAIAKLEEKLPLYNKVAFPKNGIGISKRYNLKDAPEILKYLNKRLYEKFGYKNAVIKPEPVKGVTAKIELSDDAIKKIKEGKKTTILKTEATAKEINIKQGTPKLVKFGKTWYKVKKVGLKDIEEAGGVEKMLASEGYTTFGSINVKRKNTRKFFQGENKMVVYEIEKSEKAPKTELKTTKASIASKGRITSPIVFFEDGLDINVGFGTKHIWVIEKGKRKKIKLSKWAENGKEFKNIGIIKKAGFRIVTTKNGQKVVVFPPAIRVKTDEGYVYYKLVGVNVPFEKGKGEISNDIYDINAGENSLYGIGAKYEKFVPKGSKYQWKNGWMMDVEVGMGKVEEQPTIQELDKFIKEERNKEPGDPDVTDTKSGEDGVVGMKVKPREKQTPITTTTFTNINANSDGIQYIIDGEITETTEGEKNIENIKLDNIEKAPKDKTVPGNLFSKAEDTGSTFKEDMKEKNINPNIDYKSLRDWWYGMVPDKLKLVAQNLGLSNWMLKDFQENFESTSENLTLEQYIERLKKCY